MIQWYMVTDSLHDGQWPSDQTIHDRVMPGPNTDAQSSSQVEFSQGSARSMTAALISAAQGYRFTLFRARATNSGGKNTLPVFIPHGIGWNQRPAQQKDSVTSIPAIRAGSVLDLFPSLPEYFRPSLAPIDVTEIHGGRESA